MIFQFSGYYPLQKILSVFSNTSAEVAFVSTKNDDNRDGGVIFMFRIVCPPDGSKLCLRSLTQKH